MIPFLLSNKDLSNKVLIVALAAVSFTGLFFIFIKRFLSMYLFVYLDNDIVSSDGVIIRLAMVSLPSLVFLLLDLDQIQIKRTYYLQMFCLLFLSFSLGKSFSAIYFSR